MRLPAKADIVTCYTRAGYGSRGPRGARDHAGGGGWRRAAQSGNRAFCSEVTKWAFHERGVLRVTNLHHKCASLAPVLDINLAPGSGGFPSWSMWRLRH